MIRNLLEEYAKKNCYSLDGLKDFIIYRQEKVGYCNSKCEIKDVYCANCDNLKLYDYDDITYENVLQCNKTKQMYASLYCRDNIKICWCVEFKTKKKEYYQTPI